MILLIVLSCGIQGSEGVSEAAHTGAFTSLDFRTDPLSANEWEGLSLVDFHEWCSLSVGRPTILPGLAALHLALIKYTVDDVSLAPGSLGFPRGTKHPGRQL